MDVEGAAWTVPASPHEGEPGAPGAAFALEGLAVAAELSCKIVKEEENGSDSVAGNVGEIAPSVQVVPPGGQSGGGQLPQLQRTSCAT